MEAILQRHAAGQPGCIVKVNEPAGGLVLYAPGKAEADVLYRAGGVTQATRAGVMDQAD